MKKILTILGARPQFVKAAVFSRLVHKYNHFEEIIVHTGQHYDDNMSKVFFDEMQIPKPKYSLNVSAKNHAAMTGEMLTGIEEILQIENPDFVIVYGDTNTTLAGALATGKHSAKLVHIEGGLRSFNRQMPEEINRIITDTLSDIIFCPSATAVQNLENEGAVEQQKQIIISGDIMKDAVLYYRPIAAKKSSILNLIDINDKPIILVTIHRQENTNDLAKLSGIFTALDELSKNYQIILPLHPRTKKYMKQYGLSTQVKLIDPIGYFDMLTLLQACDLVMTDSGGLQKEAYFNGKPAVILREETEWIELISNSFALLTGANKNKILEAVEQFKDHNLDFSKNIFGKDVGEKIYHYLFNLIK